MSKIAVVLLTLFAAQPVFAQSLSAGSATARFGVLRPTQPNPYRKLFAPQPAVKLSSAVTAPKSRIVCGMTIVEGDPKIDPKFVMPPKSDGVDHKIRAIAPPTCNASKQ
jgi:hypothetical protein